MNPANELDKYTADMMRNWPDELKGKYRAGVLVRYNTDDDGTIYRILELRGDRVLMEAVNTSLHIYPQTVALIADLERL